MSVRLHVPGSKSMTQRALVIGALAARDTRIVGGLDCDDVERLTRGLQALGAIIEREGEDIRVRPGRLSARGQRLDLGNAGTALRFCAALSLVVPGELTLDGDARMRERPVGPLGDALGRLGVRVTYGAGPGCPPMTVERVSRPGASVQVDGGVSSQFASGLLLAAPQLESGLTVHLTGRVVSAPYLRMTTTMMTRAGARVTWEGEATIRVQSGAYFQGTDEAVVVVEPDWSAASFLLAGGFVCGRKVEVDGLVEPERSCQGDAVFGRMLDELAAPTSHDFDLSVSPDLIAPLAIAALFAPGPTCIHGVGHARLKESDRIAVLAGELRKAGADVEERTDGLWIEPLRAMPTSEVWLDPHADHRMAMAFGLLSLRLPGLRVRDPGCVRKSFPSFWAQLDRLRSGGG